MSSAASRPTAGAFDRGHTDDLMAFLTASPSPYHAVASAAERLEKAGFRRVEETASWDGTSGGKYVIRGGAIIADCSGCSTPTTG